MKTQIRPVTDVITAIVSLLAIFAALPYELGDVATIIPPEWKARMVVVGAVSTALLRVLRPYLPSPQPNVPPEPKDP